MHTDKKIVEFIKGKRQRYPRIGKEKLKPLLDLYCKENGIRSISESTIGKVIKRNKLFFQKAGRIYHDPNSKFAQSAQKRKKRLRVKHPIRHEDYGQFPDRQCIPFYRWTEAIYYLCH